MCAEQHDMIALLTAELDRTRAELAHAKDAGVRLERTMGALLETLRFAAGVERSVQQAITHVTGVTSNGLDA